MSYSFSSYLARIKRCFVCRSRGELGDCKDPFLFNATTAESNRAVDAQPCAAGWCAKIIEGKGDGNIIPLLEIVSENKILLLHLLQYLKKKKF